MFSFLLKFCGFQNEVAPSATKKTLTKMKPLSDEGRAKVYSAELNGKAVAVKLFHDRQWSQEHSDYEVPDYNLFLNEVERLQKLKHPNIIELYSFIAEENYQALVLELMPNKSFINYLKIHQNDSRDKKLCTRIALDVCKGLVYLHALRLIHCDIKADNVLLDADMKGKICDFETVAELLPKADFAVTKNPGTNRWSAPERYDSQVFKQAYDIYPLAWLIFLGQIKNGFTPYGENFTSNQVESFHRSGKIPDQMDTVSPDLKPLILSCWKKRPDERPSALEVQVKLLRHIELS